MCHWRFVVAKGKVVQRFFLDFSMFKVVQLLH
jgi:hypothetical protein